MRPIKFRAWDKNLKTMFYSVDLFFPQGILTTVSIGAQNYQRPFETLELMQFTGLLDKNGKEIYEGDIVAFDNTRMMVDWYKEKARFIFWQKGWGEVHDVNSEAEVIGNIYESPEMLK